MTYIEINNKNKTSNHFYFRLSSDFEINVRSLLECVTICTKSLSCDFLYFNQSVSICTGVHESLAQELVKTETMGDLYKSKGKI